MEIPPGRPQFEVLVVDAMSPDEEEALREELRQLRRPEDHFGYELLVVPSFEDALVAVLVNVNLQACVLRHGFEVASGHDLSPLRHFFSNITPDEGKGTKARANTRLVNFTIDDKSSSQTR